MASAPDGHEERRSPSPSSTTSSSSQPQPASSGVTTPASSSITHVEATAKQPPAPEQQHSDAEKRGEEEALVGEDGVIYTSEYDERHLPAVPAAEHPGVRPLAVDAGTPDAWVARDERMIRLTGKHPYNCEAPVADLWKAGFLTPQSLFYVRTHGATPRVSPREAAEWRVRVHGLVRREASFTVDDLKRLFPTVTLPITLVCAGNRRREQNVVAKGLGFNWGSSGVSTGLFTGVYLADVLEYCQPIRAAGAYPYRADVGRRARHVIFEGSDELPKGKYGTSQRIRWAMDRSKAMLLAWGLNGEPLSADHGYPLRLVVPGQIGGRMVKWLNRIEVSERESQHHLHFFDNKVLPAHVSADEARSETHWWHDEKYVINELNVNAACSRPAHDDAVELEPQAVADEAAAQGDAAHRRPPAPTSAPKTYKVGGYAYTGGGRRVDRVEVTLDQGKTWRIADLKFPEDVYRVRAVRDHPFYGTLDLSETEMSFAWCFWEIEYALTELAEAPCISVRAWDEALSVQPEKLIWNAMGMMNNCWFRVAIHKSADGKSIRFEHPTVPGTGKGGWMERLKEEERDIVDPIFRPDVAGAEDVGDGADAATTTTVVAKTTTTKVKTAEEKARELEELMTIEANRQRRVTREELLSHADDVEPWFVVDGHVYDGTGFLSQHPGGRESITLVAGEDASEDFHAVHSLDAKRTLAQFHVGRLAEGALALAPALAAEVLAAAEAPDAPFLHNKVWKRARLAEKRVTSHDSYLFRFALAREDQRVGLPVGQHVYLRLRDEEGEWVQRAYTPFSGDAQLGTLDILIKVYRAAPGFERGGRMTTLLEKMRAGDESDEAASWIEIKGPTGHFTFLGQGRVRIDHEERDVRNVAMVAGGSGITPIWSTLRALADDEASRHVRVSILDANREERDILARQELESLCAEPASQGRISLYHVLSGETPSGWTMGRGRLNLDHLRDHLPAPGGRDTLALLCGPPAMEESVLEGLHRLGWRDENIVRF